MGLKSGTLLQGGKYKIIRFLSSGGFGCTYEAEHTLLESRVAIKEFFVKDFCNRDEATMEVSVATQSKVGLVTKLKKKFLEEAKAVFKMHHPNIVRVIDIFEEYGTAYYVMEYIDGLSLHDMVKKRGPLPEKEAVDYILQVCDALEYVHSLNRLHLDVKPGNIMIDRSGQAKLIDFGASKHYDEDSGENTSTLLGVNTKGYAPIEQSTQSFTTFSPATDVYALGATLYKILTGITPPDSVSLMSEEVTLSPLPLSVSQPVRDAIEKAMQTKRKDRFQSAAAFKSKLVQGGRWENEEERTVLDVSTHSKKRIYMLGGIGILLGMLIFCIMMLSGWLDGIYDFGQESIVYKSDLSAIQIGDYLYADGTYTHVLDSANLENCSGCVFNLTTTGDEKNEGWTHGHIVALKDAVSRSGETTMAWGPEETNTLIGNFTEYNPASKDRSGYINCLMDSTCASPAFSSIEDLDGRVFTGKLPQGSEWYVPALGEWVDILTNLGGAQIKPESASLAIFQNQEVASALFEKIGLCNPDGKEYEYWSSTQQGMEDWGPAAMQYRAWAIYGEGEFGNVGNAPKRNKMAVRPVAAF